MNTKKSTDNAGALGVFNYCLSFIDLLGQRDIFKGQQLLPLVTSGNEKKLDKQTVLDSIRGIYRLQRDANELLKGVIGGRADSPLRKKLSPQQQALWDEMQLTKITEQRWSDGLVAFVCLGDKEVKCPLNGIFGLFGLCGILCFLGLAGRQPVRGAIDIAWGVELHPGEIFGPVVARAHELESEVAQYPRIVVGAHVIDYLNACLAQPLIDMYSQVNKTMAELCLNMLISDADGFFILHYLGDAFRNSITTTQHQLLYDKALKFVLEQIELHQRSGDSKLAFRYAHLMHYFHAHPPQSV